MRWKCRYNTCERKVNAPLPPKKKSFGYLEVQMGNEKWVNLTYNRELGTEVVRQSLSLTDYEANLNSTMTTPEYMRSFASTGTSKGKSSRVNVVVLRDKHGDELETVTDYCKLHIPMSKSEFAHQILDEQIKSILRQAQVVKFSQLISITNSTEYDKMLDSLNLYALLLNGHWVVKSLIYYPVAADKKTRTR